MTHTWTGLFGKFNEAKDFRNKQRDKGCEFNEKMDVKRKVVDVRRDEKWDDG